MQCIESIENARTPFLRADNYLLAHNSQKDYLFTKAISFHYYDLAKHENKNKIFFASHIMASIYVVLLFLYIIFF